MSVSAFGTAALNDPSFVFGLEHGRDPRLGTINRVRAYIAKARVSAA